MSISSATKHRSALLCLAIACLLHTGCLHALGLQQSSLAPRRASLENTPSNRLVADRTPINDHLTVRSQDAQLGTPSGSGHSPTAAGSPQTTISLLQPSMLPNPDNTSRPSTVPSASVPDVSANLPATQKATHITRHPAISPTSGTQAVFSLEGFDQRPPQTEARLQLQPPSASNKQLGFTVDQLRQFMNERSQNPMTSGHVLAEKPERWDVLSRTTGAGHTTPGSTDNQTGSAATTASPFQMASSSRELPAEPIRTANAETSATTQATEVGLEQPFPPASNSEFGFRPARPATEPTELPEVETDVATPVPPPTDDSMLTRLKGLYDPSEDGVARKIWRRQIPKLPNPWNVFKDRSEAALQSAEDFVENAEAEITAVINPESPETSLPVPEASAGNSGIVLSTLVQQYEQRLASWPKTPAERPENPNEYRLVQQELRLLYLLQDRPEEAASAIELLSPAEQQFWQALILSLAEYREASNSNTPSVHYTGSLHQLRTAVNALSPLADLRIRRMDICSRILSYGRIEAFPSNDFDPGRPLLLYVELENFGTRTTSNGHYQASFDATLQIFERGKETAKETIRLTDITDDSTSVRTDYFQSYDLTLPSHLMAGEYEIRLKLRDKLTGKVARSKVQLQVR